MLIIPIQLSASERSYEAEKIIYNPYNPANETAWDEYQTRQAAQKKSNGFNPCSCVSYARWATGIDVGPIYLAKYHPVNSSTPAVGGLAITYESWAGHISVVTAISEQTFRVKEYNYSSCKYTERELPQNYRLLKGFYNP